MLFNKTTRHGSVFVRIEEGKARLFHHDRRFYGPPEDICDADDVNLRQKVWERVKKPPEQYTPLNLGAALSRFLGFAR